MNPPALQRRTWLAPLIFFQVYLAITVLLFFQGPWPWQVDNGPTVLAFLVGAQLAMALGYRAAWPGVQGLTVSDELREQEIESGLKFLKQAVVVSWLFAIPTSVSRADSWIPDVAEGLANAGAVYTAAFERGEGGGGLLVVEYLRMLASPWLIAVFPLTVVYWRRISLAWRLPALGSIAFTLAIYLATGVNKGFADIVICLPWLVVLSASLGVLKVKRIGLKIGVASVVLFAAFLGFFSAGQQQRFGSGTEYGTFFTGLSVLQANSDHFVTALLPEPLKVVFEALSRYVVQGYYALSMALSSDSPSTLGVGHSMFLARNADNLFGTHYFVTQSLPGVLESQQGWGQFQLWHSIYPWIASDVGFVGTLLVMAAFGYLLARSWAISLTTGSPFWVAMLFLMLVLFYYVPANNQIFQTGETCVGFFLLLMMMRRPRLRTPRKVAA